MAQKKKFDSLGFCLQDRKEQSETLRTHTRSQTQMEERVKSKTKIILNKI